MTRVRTTSGHHGPATPSPVRGGRGRARRGRRGRRGWPGRFRGLTLLELLLGITIVAALGGLVFASLRPLREEARLRTARDRIDAVVREGRELAMRSGEPVAMVFDPVAGRLEAAPIGEDAVAAAVDSAGLAGLDGLDDPMVAAAMDEPTLAASEAFPVPPSVDLDRGLSLTMRPPAVDDVGGVAGDPFNSWSDDRESWRLVVFLPDGTLLLSRPAWLGPVGPDSADEERERPAASGWRLTIHPWTGEPTWTDEAAARLAADDAPVSGDGGDVGDGFEDFEDFSAEPDAGGGFAAPPAEFGP